MKNHSESLIRYSFYVFYAWIVWELKERIRVHVDPEFLLFVPIVLLSFTFFLHSNVVFQALNFLIIPVLIVAHTLRLANLKRKAWDHVQFAGDLINQVVVQSLKNILIPFQMIFGSWFLKKANGTMQSSLKIMLGLLISLPLVIIVITLLSSADSVFEQQISKLNEMLSYLSVGELIFNGGWVIVVTVYLFGYLRGLKNSQEEDAIESIESISSDRSNSELSEGTTSIVAFTTKKPFTLDPVITMTILTVINLVYILFTIIQF